VPPPSARENKVEKDVLHFGREKVIVNPPALPRKAPQLHHKSPPRNTSKIAKSPIKHHISPHRFFRAKLPLQTLYPSPMKVLVIDIGGTNIKVASTDIRVPIKIPSGPTMNAEQMAKDVLAATAGWSYDCISIGYPGPVTHDRPLAEPHNLAAGWVDFPYRKAFGKPIRFINDAAMQALGGYKGGRMLFLGTGTGLGSAMIFDGIVIPLELAHLPYKKGFTYEEYIGLAGLERRGKARWRKSVLDIISRLQAALVCDCVLLGGGNAKLMKNLPNHVVLGANSNAIDGGLKLWQGADPTLPAHPAKGITKSSRSR
jgi:polyphosphate glucokinase